MKKKVEAPNRNKKKVIRQTEGNRILYICPKCKQPIEFHKKHMKSLCTNCGQYLDWAGSESLDCIWLVCQNMEEAYYSAKQYEDICGTSYGLNLDEWRLKADRWWPKNLYFPFLDKTAYGRFMRWVAKDGPTILKF